MNLSRPQLITMILALAGALVPAWSGASAQSGAGGLGRIGHIVVIYEENHSFDNLYGNFPGANGIAQAQAQTLTQMDRDGKPFATLPAALNTTTKKLDDRIPANLPNRTFKFNDYYKADEKTGDMIHAFYTEQLQIDGGKMDKFAAWSDSHGQAMGYWDISGQPLYDLAKQYTLDDNFFHAAFGGSYLNHFWLICACTPVFPNAPQDLVAVKQANGQFVVDNADGTTREFAVSPDGHGINTTQPLTAPYNKGSASSPGPDDAHRLPLQTMPTIGDELSAKNITWAWYAGGWNDAVAGKPDPLFQYHHQPFNYFKNFASGQARTDHPGYANISQGEQHAADLIKAIQASPIWNDTVVIVTYDEHGGSWDHVAPPSPDKDGARADQWGPGLRVPTMVISPLVRRGYVDHTLYDTTSILKLIEKRFDLAALGTRDAAVNDMTNALNLSAAAGVPAAGSAGPRSNDRKALLCGIAALILLVAGYSLLRAHHSHP